MRWAMYHRLEDLFIDLKEEAAEGVLRKLAPLLKMAP
jgi:hypothetical protein